MKKAILRLKWFLVDTLYVVVGAISAIFHPIKFYQCFKKFGEIDKKYDPILLSLTDSMLDGWSGRLDEQYKTYSKAYDEKFKEKCKEQENIIGEFKHSWYISRIRHWFHSKKKEG